MNKYHAVKTEVDGIVFASKKEAKRYGELKLLLRGELISCLELQKAFPLAVNGVQICKYVADFVYRACSGHLIIEDTKGQKTPVYQIKKKLMLACHGIHILET